MDKDLLKIYHIAIFLLAVLIVISIYGCSATNFDIVSNMLLTLAVVGELGTIIEYTEQRKKYKKWFAELEEETKEDVESDLSHEK